MDILIHGPLTSAHDHSTEDYPTVPFRTIKTILDGDYSRTAPFHTGILVNE